MHISLFIKALIFSGASLLISPLASANEFDQLNFITESYPPYNFESEGKLQGISVDLLMAATKNSSSSLTTEKIRLLPWPRAYKMALLGPKIVLFSTTRTEEREQRFNWVGPISPTRIVLMAKKSDAIVISSASDIKSYVVGAIPNDIGDQLVKETGIKSSSITYIAKADSLAKMLAAGRIKLWAYEENVARWFIKEAGLDNNDFEPVYTLKESDLYYAFSNDVEKETLELLQKAIDEVKASAVFDEIKANYL
jgi:polar amino acid transport system substrate-binding protein